LSKAFRRTPPSKAAQPKHCYQRHRAMIRYSSASNDSKISGVKPLLGALLLISSIVRFKESTSASA
jgi:hypothetical protein